MADRPKAPGSPGFELDDLGGHNCFTCQNRAKTEWCVIKPEDLELLDSAKRVMHFRRGEALYEQGTDFTGLFCVEAGTVALRRLDENGNASTVQLAHRGQTVGYQDYFTGSRYSSRAEALEATTACRVPTDALRQILDNNPSLDLQFLKHLAQDLGDAQEQLLQRTLPVRTRLAHLLLTLKDKYGRAEADGTACIDLPMTRLDMASMLGARHETVYRTLADLESDEVLVITGQTVRIPNLRRLLKEIGAGE